MDRLNYHMSLDGWAVMEEMVAFGNLGLGFDAHLVFVAKVETPKLTERFISGFLGWRKGFSAAVVDDDCVVDECDDDY